MPNGWRRHNVSAAGGVRMLTMVTFRTIPIVRHRTDTGFWNARNGLYNSHFGDAE